MAASREEGADIRRLDKAIMAKNQIQPQQPPVFLTKHTPVQRRSVQTFELILRATAELLSEVGIEGLSTSLICQRAGLTPPALYRYFPNKFAVVKELGNRLMERMNEAFLAWLTAGQPLGPDHPQTDSAASLKQIQETIKSITTDFPASGWIMRALRAVPVLQDVRLASHNFVTTRAFGYLRPRYPRAADAELRFAIRLAIEVMYSATEMILDDPGLDEDTVNAGAAEMVVRYFQKFA
jgi:AcrR family transcriptional regulator